MVVAAGLTGLVTATVRAASEYHVIVPVAHVADNVEFPPAQIVAGLAVAAVGAVVNAVTVTVTGVPVLLQVPLTHAP